MENENYEAQRALLLKLREAVNSREEFEWVQAQLSALTVRRGTKFLAPVIVAGRSPHSLIHGAETSRRPTRDAGHIRLTDLKGGEMKWNS